jgi:hypothetical protein
MLRNIPEDDRIQATSSRQLHGHRRNLTLSWILKFYQRPPNLSLNPNLVQNNHVSTFKTDYSMYIITLSEQMAVSLNNTFKKYTSNYYNLVYVSSNYVVIWADVRKGKGAWGSVLVKALRY